jgi:hypothetical protein
MPAKSTGTPQVDPQAPPAPYINISMGDTKDILDWEPDPSLDHSQVNYRGEGVSNIFTHIA